MYKKHSEIDHIIKRHATKIQDGGCRLLEFLKCHYYVGDIIIFLSNSGFYIYIFCFITIS